MAFNSFDRVRETTTVTGTGAATLLGAVSGFHAFSSATPDGDKFYYAIVHRTADEWEVGIGTYGSSGNTITRGATPISSSTFGSAVSFSAGTKDVFVTLPGSKAFQLDATSSKLYAPDNSIELAKLDSIGQNQMVARTASGTGAASPIDFAAMIDAAGGQRLLSGVYNGSEVASSTAVTDLINYSVPANLLGATGGIRCQSRLTVYHNSGAACIYYLEAKWGGTRVWLDGYTIPNDTDYRELWVELELQNLNSTSLQAVTGRVTMNNGDAGAGGGIGNYGATDPANLFGSGAPANDPAKATTSAQTLQLTIQMDTSHADNRFRHKWSKIWRVA